MRFVVVVPVAAIVATTADPRQYSAASSANSLPDLGKGPIAKPGEHVSKGGGRYPAVEVPFPA